MAKHRKIHQLCWRAKGLCDGSRTVNEMAEKLEAAAAELRAMAEAGVGLAYDVDEDYATLETGNSIVAKKYGLEPIDV